MKEQLFFWKKQMPDTLKVYLNRESVCAGDDCESHRVQIEFDINATISDLVYTIKQQDYLASIEGGKATWVLMNQKREIAVLAQEWATAKYFVSDKTLLSELNIKADQIELFVRYHRQTPPDMIFDEIEKRITSLAHVCNGCQ